MSPLRCGPSGDQQVSHCDHEYPTWVPVPIVFDLPVHQRFSLPVRLSPVNAWLCECIISLLFQSYFSYFFLSFLILLYLFLFSFPVRLSHLFTFGWVYTSSYYYFIFHNICFLFFLPLFILSYFLFFAPSFYSIIFYFYSLSPVLILLVLTCCHLTYWLPEVTREAFYSIIFPLFFFSLFFLLYSIYFYSLSLVLLWFFLTCCHPTYWVPGITREARACWEYLILSFGLTDAPEAVGKILQILVYPCMT